MAPKYNNFWSPIWKYLNQPLFNRDRQIVLNPRRFWYLYKVDLLERCWVRECKSRGHHHY